MLDKQRIKWVFVAIAFTLAIIYIWLHLSGPQVFDAELDPDSDTAERPSPRPEVVAWIDKHFESQPRKRMAMLRLAEAGQYVLSNPDDPNGAAKKESFAMACFRLAFERPYPEIEGMAPYLAIDEQTFNTFARSQRYANYLGAMNGTVSKVVELKAWTEQCEKPL